MNERIKELADKVATLMPGVYNIEYESGKSGVEFTEDALEKFAELIVRECAKFCEHESNDDEYDQYDMGMAVKAVNIKTAIMKEFGIKE